LVAHEGHDLCGQREGAPRVVLHAGDIFDALTASDRPYKKAVPVEKALQILQWEVNDGKCDGELYKVFVEAEVYKNETWRHKRGTTDVLSFAQATPELLEQWSRAATATADANADAPDRVLGDLVISLQVVQQRSPLPAAYEQDLVTLLAHGLLHLIGFEHANPRARKKMLSLQDELVQIATSRGRVPHLDLSA
jgi:rRNA maturation RNase YbeY